MYSRENGLMIKQTDSVYICIVTEQNIQDIGKMIYKMEKELKFGKKIYNNKYYTY